MENSGRTEEREQAVDTKQLLKVRREKLAELQANGQNPFEITKYDVTNHSAEIKDNFEALESKTVRIAGRMMSKRVMGKASFCNVQDLQGNIQCLCSKRQHRRRILQRISKSLDIGDIIGIEGEVFKTKTGEISIHAAKMYTALQESSDPSGEVPRTDKYRYPLSSEICGSDHESGSKRYLYQTFPDPQSRSVNILDGQGFMEVETPMLVANAGGAAARPFETHFNALNEDLKLRISLELYLKRLIVGGLERVYEIGRVFRNEGLDTRHNPEFTLMELYQAYTDYDGMMDLTENLYRYRGTGSAAERLRLFIRASRWILASRSSV